MVVLSFKRSIWEQLATGLSNIQSVWAGEPQPVQDKLESLVRNLFADKAAEIGWEYPQNEAPLTGLLRTLVLSESGLNGNKR